MRASARVALVFADYCDRRLCRSGSLDKLSDTTSQGFVSPEDATARITPGEGASKSSAKEGASETQKADTPSEKKDKPAQKRNARTAKGAKKPAASARAAAARPTPRRNRYLLRVSRCSIHGRPHRQPETSHAKRCGTPSPLALHFLDHTREIADVAAARAGRSSKLRTSVMSSFRSSASSKSRLISLSDNRSARRFSTSRCRLVSLARRSSRKVIAPPFLSTELRLRPVVFVSAFTYAPK